MIRFIFLTALALTGCTTASTRMLSDHSAVISASDLGTGSPRAVRRKALVTAAMEARSRGYGYFAIVDARSSREPSRTNLPGQIGVNGSGESSYVTFDIDTNLTVRFLRASELPANRDGIYDAAAVLAGRSYAAN